MRHHAKTGNGQGGARTRTGFNSHRILSLPYRLRCATEVYEVALFYRLSLVVMDAFTRVESCSGHDSYMKRT